VATMAGKGDLMVTGQLGDVMRESAMAALSYIRSRADELQIDPGFQDTTDLHIHLPENAIPKDGPSAGITIATTLISALTGRPVRGDIAMTGEITLRGRVLAVGGLKEKALAAHHANIYHLIVPAENKKDLAEIPAKIRQRIRFTLVENMDQVIEAALLDASSLAESSARDEQTLPEPRPLRRDERVAEPGPQNRNSRHGDGAPANEKSDDEKNGHEPPPLITPPPGQIAGDSYPQAQAQDPDE